MIHAALDLYIKVDATHSEPVELRFECDFRLGVDSFVRLSRPALCTLLLFPSCSTLIRRTGNLPTSLTGSLHLKPVISPASSGPSTPRQEFDRRLWKESRQTRKPSTDNAAMMRPVEEEVRIAGMDDTQGGWNSYASERMGLPGMCSVHARSDCADELYSRDEVDLSTCKHLHHSKTQHKNTWPLFSSVYILATGQ